MPAGPIVLDLPLQRFHCADCLCELRADAVLVIRSLQPRPRDASYEQQRPDTEQRGEQRIGCSALDQTACRRLGRARVPFRLTNQLAYAAMVERVGEGRRDERGYQPHTQHRAGPPRQARIAELEIETSEGEGSHQRQQRTGYAVGPKLAVEGPYRRQRECRPVPAGHAAPGALVFDEPARVVIRMSSHGDAEQHRQRRADAPLVLMLADECREYDRIERGREPRGSFLRLDPTRPRAIRRQCCCTYRHSVLACPGNFRQSDSSRELLA